MGFFKRFFSLGSKKSRRKQQPAPLDHLDPNGRFLAAAEQADRDATRLLRSTSANFAVASEDDYPSLPPLPRPAVSTVATPPPAPTTSKSEASVQRRGTYTVKVLERKLESRTEFPNANPPIIDLDLDERSVVEDSPLPKRASSSRLPPMTPRDKSRLLRLRQDPSVASLLNMYDDNGRILSTAFSNTPPTIEVPQELLGRSPVKRSGSTLRQLLGESDCENHGTEEEEGDISWAERYLGEHAGSRQSLASTAPVETPKDLDDHFPDDPSTKPFLPNFTFSEGRTSQDFSVNSHVINSMEVEVSAENEHDAPTPLAKACEPEEKTPKPAAEVFGFLHERRKSVLQRQRSQLEHGYAQPAHRLKLSAPASLSSSYLSTARASTNLTDTGDFSIISSVAQIQTATVTKLTPVLNPLSRSSDALHLLYSNNNAPARALRERPLSPTNYQPVRHHLTGDSLASTSSHKHALASSSHKPTLTAASASKIPRGPRPAPSNSALNETRPTTIPEKHPSSAPRKHTPHHTRKHPLDLPTPAPTPTPRPRTSKHTSDPHTPRRAKRLSSPTDGSPSAKRRAGRRVPSREVRNKENSPPSRVLRACAVVPPSPASSGELSPVAKEMMVSLRRQRMRVREEVPRPRSARRKGGSGLGR